jgi:hypothetical protein
MDKGRGTRSRKEGRKEDIQLNEGTREGVHITERKHAARNERKKEEIQLKESTREAVHITEGRKGRMEERNKRRNSIKEAGGCSHGRKE